MALENDGDSRAAGWMPHLNPLNPELVLKILQVEEG